MEERIYHTIKKEITVTDVDRKNGSVYLDNGTCCDIHSECFNTVIRNGRKKTLTATR